MYGQYRYFYLLLIIFLGTPGERGPFGPQGVQGFPGSIGPVGKISTNIFLINKSIVFSFDILNKKCSMYQVCRDRKATEETQVSVYQFKLQMSFIISLNAIKKNKFTVVFRDQRGSRKSRIYWENRRTWPTRCHRSDGSKR